MSEQKNAIQTSITFPSDKPGEDFIDEIAGFLFTHLDQYGDKIEDIKKCLNYALSSEKGKGGFVVTARDDKNCIAGVVVINLTGMSGYIPENILVYIAVDRAQRGKGVGKKLMKATIDNAEGAIALHVEPDNPARHLYTKVGFTNKYLEMRYQPEK
ncbi:MAG: GNAT family N-acetyltransferase [Saprospirales bacterium]|nr:MAG: GNAT family N-acetyltransferase [Saprospirales bacterium]